MARKKKPRNIFSLTLGEVRIYQILDGEGLAIGLLGTTLDDGKFGDLFDEWNIELNEQIEEGEDPDTSVDGLAIFIQARGLTADRIYLESEYNRDF